MVDDESDSFMDGVDLPLRCPGCGALLAVASSWLGQQISCPRCDTQTEVAVAHPTGDLAERQTAPGQLDLPGFLLAFSFIPGGIYWQGSQTRYKIEMPRRRSCLPEPFWLATTPVTQAAFERVMRFNPSSRKGADLPVENVTWHQAFDFCQNLAEQARSEGLLPRQAECRLPTEAEWEWVASAAPFASAGVPEASILDEFAWHRGNSGRQTQPVGRKRAICGLSDLFGNVREWCLDWFAACAGGNEHICPSGPSRGERKVLKGGSFLAAPWRCHPADRVGLPPGLAHPAVGFRPLLADCGFRPR